MANQLPISCFICCTRDENEDPDLYIACTPDDPSDLCCRLSCHIECAFKSKCVGADVPDQFIQLDANYWCISCGKISDLLRYWRQQVSLAKDARFVEDLCKRLSLCYKLMYGTKRYVDLHNKVALAKELVDGELNELVRHSSIRAVSRLAVADEVQRLCAEAIYTADELIAHPELQCRADLFPPACRVKFEEISATSIKISLVKIPAARFESLMGFNLWCWQSNHQVCTPEDRNCFAFPTLNNRVTISNLHPATEYSLRLVSYDLRRRPFGITEVRCKTPPAPSPVPHPELDIPDLNDEPPSMEPRNLVHIPDLNVEIPADLNDETSAERLQEKVPEEEPSRIDETEASLQEKEPEAGPSEVAPTGSSRKECVKILCNLQQEGLISVEFRMKFLSWFGFVAKEEHREMVFAYIEALADDHQSLARQLIDSFNSISQ